MQRSLTDLERYKVSATDGDIGSVVNFLLDDQRWVVRYLVVKTGGFLDGRRVLISPISFRLADWPSQCFQLALTIDKVKHSPSVDVEAPVSRQHEREYHRHYGYPYYWGYSSLWGIGAYPSVLAAGMGNSEPAEQSDKTSGDIHLRSARELRGYQIQGSDEEIGHVEDFLVDDESWELRYLVIDTSNWWSGKKVLVAPHWASRISWEERKVYVNMSRQQVKSSPEWYPTLAIKREYEARLYEHYGREVYWADGDTPTEAQLAYHSGSKQG